MADPKPQSNAGSRNAPSFAITPYLAGLFFLLAAAASGAAAYTLLAPGSKLDAIWSIKPAEHKQLLTMSASAGPGFVGLAIVALITAVGCLRRRKWGWRLAVTIFVLNATADALRITSAPVEGVIGVVVTVPILYWLWLPNVRRLFAA